MSKQTEATNYIQNLLASRKIAVIPHKIKEGSREWMIFEYHQKQIGIDTAAGVWVRESVHHSWICLAAPCNVSGALQAVEFLIQD